MKHNGFVNNGFMFSIEMLAVITVLIVVVATMVSFVDNEISETKTPHIKNSNRIMLALYDSEEENITKIHSDNVICNSVADFDNDLNIIIERRFCGWEK
jgi:hypothetical protein